MSREHSECFSCDLCKTIFGTKYKVVVQNEEEKNTTVNTLVMIDFIIIEFHRLNG